MLSKENFSEQVADAYEHLYDLVYLRSHLLADVLVPHLENRKEKAWELHHLLISAVEDIDPGPEPPTFSREWRRNRLLVMRYIDGADPKAVADELAVSRRHYYRERDAALETLSTILWNRYIAQPSGPLPTSEHGTPGPSSPINVASNRLEALRLEMARVVQTERYVQVGEAFEGATRLLTKLLEANDLSVDAVFPEELPAVSVGRTPLRQILMGMMGYLTEHARHATIRLKAEAKESAVSLYLRVEPADAMVKEAIDSDRQQLSQVEELATLSGAHVTPIGTKGAIIGFDALLPAGSRRTVLAMDDNPDVLELIERYLRAHDYWVVTVRTAGEMIDLAQRLRPFAIMLDLMMPEQDGWELLQTLLHHNDTQHIPILVCSVLHQKELALSLGATAFVEKPFTEQSLLSALEALDPT